MTQANIRSKIWERKYPGCNAEFAELLGSDISDLSALMKWKDTWQSTPVTDGQPSSATCFELGITSSNGGYPERRDLSIKAVETADACGLHPYYYQQCVRFEYGEKVVTYVRFFSPEQMVMFKLAWQ